MEKRFELAMGLLMILVVAALAGRGFELAGEAAGGPGLVGEVAGVLAEMLAGESKDGAGGERTEQKVVVIDAGHGGVDPGKVGVNDALEKEINLKIAGKLKGFLEAEGVRVVMTRETDAGLYAETDGNKKMADMKARCRIIEESGADIVVSIHQNSYHEASVRGAQVFYYTHSEEGKRLAEGIQASFAEVLGEKSSRTAKGNTDYYLLLNVPQPIVIVECGFLSNWEEAQLLSDEAYQEKVARIIHLGVLQYLNGEKAAE